MLQRTLSGRPCVSRSGVARALHVGGRVHSSGAASSSSVDARGSLATGATSASTDEEDEPDADADAGAEEVEDAGVVVDADPVPTTVLGAGVAVVVGAGALEEGDSTK